MGASLLYVWGIEQGGLSRQRGRVLGTLAVVAALAGLAGSVVWAAQAQRIPFANGTFWWLFAPAAGWGWQVWGEWVIGLCFALRLLGVLVGSQPILRKFGW